MVTGNGADAGPAVAVAGAAQPAHPNTPASAATAPSAARTQRRHPVPVPPPSPLIASAQRRPHLGFGQGPVGSTEPQPERQAPPTGADPRATEHIEEGNRLKQLAPGAPEGIG